LILDGVITRKGVIIPSTKAEYEPIAKILKECGISLTEESR